MHFFVRQGAKTGVMPKYNEDFGNAAWQKKALILTIVLNFNSFLRLKKDERSIPPIGSTSSSRTMSSLETHLYS